MATKQVRRKKSESRLESATCDPTTFLEVLNNASLSVKQNVYRLLQKRGPFTNAQLLMELPKEGKLNSTKYSISKALSDLKDLGLVVKVNGGWAIHNWHEVGRD